MQTILIVVTALALVIAGGMTIVVVTMLRKERARSEARIEALTALAAEPVVPVHQPHVTANVVREPLPRPEPVQRAPRVAPAPVLTRDTATATADDLEIRPSTVDVADLFVQPDRPSPWLNRLVAIGCLAAIALAIGIAVTTLSSRRAPALAGAPAETAAKADPAPLELLSLRHTQETDRFVITGTVQNPKTAAPIAHVAATVFVFGPDGAFLSSNQAPLDFTNLSSGGESPFVVSVPVHGQVGRYRVGFRTEDGHVLPHVDKRGPDALAQK